MAEWLRAGRGEATTVQWASRLLARSSREGRRRWRVPHARRESPWGPVWTRGLGSTHEAVRLASRGNDSENDLVLELSSAVNLFLRESGALMWLTLTRPDLLYAVSHSAQAVPDPVTRLKEPGRQCLSRP